MNDEGRIDARENFSDAGRTLIISDSEPVIEKLKVEGNAGAARICLAIAIDLHASR